MKLTHRQENIKNINAYLLISNIAILFYLMLAIASFIIDFSQQLFRNATVI
jgi:hypothetical protein